MRVKLAYKRASVLFLWKYRSKDFLPMSFTAPEGKADGQTTFATSPQEH